MKKKRNPIQGIGSAQGASSEALEQAVKLFHAGLQAKALEICEKAAKAASRAPQRAQALGLAGACLHAMGRHGEALSAMEAACVAAPRDADLLANLACARKDCGMVDQSIEAALGALELQMSEHAKEAFCHCVQHVSFGTSNPRLANAMALAIEEPWTRPAYLAKPAASLLALDPDAQLISRAQRAEAPSEEAALARLAANRLAGSLLRGGPICGLWGELFSSRALERLLDARRSTKGLDDKHVELLCSMACQRIANEYVWDLTPAAEAESKTAQQNCRESFHLGLPIASSDAAAAICSEGWEGQWLENWAKPSESSQGALALWILAVEEPAKMREQKTLIANAFQGSICDPVSKAVKAQYEANPYPRWTKTKARAQPGGASGWLARQLKRQTAKLPEPGPDGSLRILVAGCGTGQQSCELGMLFPESRIESIDLSSSSLAYAKAKAESLGVANASFRLADIATLELQDIGLFHMAESVGVIHHMADPSKALAAIVSKLLPGGVIKLGLYSKRARQGVDFARQIAVQTGLGSTPSQLRALRRIIYSNPGAPSFQLCEFNDFYSLSEFRDLAMHQHEICFSPLGIAELLRSTGMSFLGFQTTSQVEEAFKAANPASEAWFDLEAWERFEQDNPMAFSGMYQFHAQRPD